MAMARYIGGEYAGAVVGAWNTASQAGAFTASLVFGFLVDRFGNYDLPFYPMGILLILATILWLKIDPTKQLIPSSQMPHASAA